MLMFSDHLEFLARVTNALNHLGDPPDGMYLKVQLVQFEEGEEDILGIWSDEIGGDSWYFEGKI